MEWEQIINYPAYICTTPNSDRTEFALNELNKAGIKTPNVVYGINGSSKEGELQVIEKAKEYEMATKHFIRYGEIALAIAFYESFVSFLKTDHSHMLWFEDDIILHHNPNLIYQKLKEFKDWKNYNIIYLGTSIVNGREYALDHLKNKTYWAECTDQVVWGTQSMLIDRHAAEILINNKFNQTQIDMHIINAAKKYKQIKTAGLLFPLLLKDEKDYSWESIYAVTDPRPWTHGIPPDPEWKHVDTKILGNYKRSFGSNHTSWGLFYQKNTPSVLRSQQRFDGK